MRLMRSMLIMMLMIMNAGDGGGGDTDEDGDVYDYAAGECALDEAGDASAINRIQSRSMIFLV